MMGQDQLEVEDVNSKATNQDELVVVDRNSKAMNRDELEVGGVNSTAYESRGTRAYLLAELAILKKKHIAMHSDCIVIKLLSLSRFTFCFPFADRKVCCHSQMAGVRNILS